MNQVDIAFVELLKQIVTAERVLTRDEDLVPYALDGAETQKLAAVQRHKHGLMQQHFPSPEAA